MFNVTIIGTVVMSATATDIFVLYNDGIYLNLKVASLLHNFYLRKLL